MAHLCQSAARVGVLEGGLHHGLEFFAPMVRRIFARTPWRHSGGALEEPARAKAELASAYPA